MSIILLENFMPTGGSKILNLGRERVGGRGRPKYKHKNVFDIKVT